jgi:hypothetical protein
MSSIPHIDESDSRDSHGRLVGQARKLRRDKAKARSAGHARYLTGQACRVRVKRAKAGVDLATMAA